MARISAYHRPSSLDDALSLLHRSTVRTVVLGGGTSVVPARFDVATEVIDLQACGLGAVAIDGSTARLGATATLDTVAGHESLPAVLREAARRDQPSTLRTLATIGGAVVERGSESELLAALLAHDAAVAYVNSTGSHHRDLDDVLADPSVLHGAIVTSVSVSIDGQSAVARTGRTPMDTPIVAAVGRRRPDGTTVLAMSGVANTPCLVENPRLLTPPGDFRGSTEYRRTLGVELADRVTTALEVLA